VCVFLPADFSARPRLSGYKELR